MIMCLFLLTVDNRRSCVLFLLTVDNMIFLLTVDNMIFLLTVDSMIFLLTVDNRRRYQHNKSEMSWSLVPLFVQLSSTHSYSSRQRLSRA